MKSLLKSTTPKPITAAVYDVWQSLGGIIVVILPSVAETTLEDTAHQPSVLHDHLVLAFPYIIGHVSDDVTASLLTASTLRINLLPLQALHLNWLYGNVIPRICFFQALFYAVVFFASCIGFSTRDSSLCHPSGLSLINEHSRVSSRHSPMPWTHPQSRPCHPDTWCLLVRSNSLLGRLRCQLSFIT